ncbi:MULTISPECIES: helix-turn-helix domain-containing protein [Sphingobacterium]|uniref:helix-turn-helix domain-containing protein n=1 Tax=Sphingobacterium TaxID=28453 RepID=UPI002579A62D|nr:MULTISPECIES: helix-turn-helix transcriptional regulator [Sphingobacterium]
MIKLPFTAVFIINRVKFLRILRGFAAEELSEEIGMSDSYISSIENLLNKHQYPHQILIKIAAVLECSPRDFYPSDEVLQNNSGELVEKKVISLSNLDDAIKILLAMKLDGYFSEERSTEDILRYFYILGKPEANVVKEALSRLVNESKLKKQGEYFIEIQYI